MRRLRSLREIRLTRMQLGGVTAASLLATGAVIATALGRTGPQAQALALLSRPRVEHIVVPQEPAAPAPAAPSDPAPASQAPAPTSTGSGGGSSSSTPSQNTEKTKKKKKKKKKTRASVPVPSKVKHVFVIALTTPSYRAAFASGSTMSYLDHVLRPKGDLLTGYETLGATDLPDHLAMVSGQAPNFDTERGCTTYADFPAGAAPDKAGQVPGQGCVYPNTILTIGDQLGAADMGWKAYVEDLGAAVPAADQNCEHPNSDAVDTTLAPVTGSDYATSENPFVYFHSLLDLGDCASDDLPLTRLAGGLSSARRTANLVYIAPGLCDDGSDTPCPGVTPTGSAGADAFLRKWVPLVLSSPAYRKNGVLLIVFASSETKLPGGTRFDHPLRTGALVISRYAKAGSTDPASYTPYSVLRSIEDLFALKALGHAGAAKSFATVALPGAWAKRK
jgi:phosphatidylinositol-3-phosphatase